MSNLSTKFPLQFIAIFRIILFHSESNSRYQTTCLNDDTFYKSFEFICLTEKKDILKKVLISYKMYEIKNSDRKKFRVL